MPRMTTRRWMIAVAAIAVTFYAAAEIQHYRLYCRHRDSEQFWRRAERAEAEIARQLRVAGDFRGAASQEQVVDIVRAYAENAAAQKHEHRRWLWR